MSEVIGCRDAVQRLWEYLDHALDEVDHEAVEAHLAFCVRCCGELAFARELRQVLRDKTEVRPPADVTDRLERFIDGLGDEAGKGAWG